MMEPANTVTTDGKIPSQQTDLKGAKLRKVCAEFESLLVHYIFKSARATLPGNGLFDNTNESKMYKSMMDEQMAICVSEGKGLGLGALLYARIGMIAHGPHKTNGVAHGL
jgi:flagellar protein FlgJ